VIVAVMDNLAHCPQASSCTQRRSHAPAWRPQWPQRHPDATKDTSRLPSDDAINWSGGLFLHNNFVGMRLHRSRPPQPPKVILRVHHPILRVAHHAGNRDSPTFARHVFAVRPQLVITSEISTSAVVAT
jgi:hypothetical protein